MIEIFTKSLAACLEDVSYIESLPLVSPFKKKDGTRTLIIPVSCNTTEEDCKDIGLLPLLPSSEKKCLFWLEQSSDFRPVTAETSGKNAKYTARLTLIGWINNKLFGLDTCIGGSLVCVDLIKELQKCGKGKTFSEPFQHLIQLRNISQSNRNPFGSFSSELFDCFRLHPYSAFSLEFDIIVTFKYSCIGGLVTGAPDNC